MEPLFEKYRAYCAILGVKRPLYTEPQDTGEPHVERHGADYHYVVTNFGRELDRRATSNVEELLYWLMSLVVYEKAVEDEKGRNVEGLSYRQRLFVRELELMRLLNAEWEARRREEIEKVLRVTPFGQEAAKHIHT